MKISNNILVGVEAPRICQYWGTIHHYVTELQLEFNNLSGDELVGLSIGMDKNNILHQNYYVLCDGIINLYIISINKDTKKKTLNVVNDITEKDMIFAINDYPYVLDMDYYLKNN